MDEQPQPQRFLDRPLRSLLDVKIGTILKGYGIYLAISAVLGLVLLLVALSVWHRESGSAGLGGPGSISWGTNAGETVNPAEYRSVESGARLETVRARFGEPATTGPNPLDEVSGSGQTCLGYRSSASDATLFLLCFEDGRLVDKQKF